MATLDNLLNREAKRLFGMNLDSLTRTWTQSVAEYDRWEGGKEQEDCQVGVLPTTSVLSRRPGSTKYSKQAHG